MSWLTKLFGGTPSSMPKPKVPVSRSVLQRANGLRVVDRGGYPRGVVGEGNYQEALLKICGGYSRDGHALETAGYLVPEPDNPYDPNAIIVTIEGQKVGYLSSEDAQRYSEALVAGGYQERSVLVGAKIVGGWKTNQHDAGHFGVKLALPWPVKFTV